MVTDMASGPARTRRPWLLAATLAAALTGCGSRTPPVVPAPTDEEFCPGLDRALAEEATGFAPWRGTLVGREGDASVYSSTVWIGDDPCLVIVHADGRATYRCTIASAVDFEMLSPYWHDLKHDVEDCIDFWGPRWHFDPSPRVSGDAVVFRSSRFLVDVIIDHVRVGDAEQLRLTVARAETAPVIATKPPPSPPPSPTPPASPSPPARTPASAPAPASPSPPAPAAPVAPAPASKPILPPIAEICADLRGALDAAKTNFAGARGALRSSGAKGSEYESTLRLAGGRCNIVVRAKSPDTLVCFVRSANDETPTELYDQLKPILGGRCLAGWKGAYSSNNVSESVTYSTPGEPTTVSVALVDTNATSNLIVTVTGAAR